MIFQRCCLTTEPFSHQRFSCIIGPNGSGKSNVIDSMLFVFGYRAQKIRSKKLSVLIHSSDEHPDLQSCTVEVHFQKITDKVRRYTLQDHTPVSRRTPHSGAHTTRAACCFLRIAN